MEAEARVNKKLKKEDETVEVIRWARFLSRTVLRVLVVEADDSTQKIISALLRKCSYKVTAVPDGLKAWEMLKRKPYDIDLILSEVELPSISGFALLTLVTEHEIWKNIPVIMMSSNDSASTVYKCTLKGAADFLLKPLRKNELKNLWQHVWRRQAKVEITEENNASSNQPSRCTNKLSSSLLLDLSLKRPNTNGYVNEDRQKLNYSDASAFSRYVNHASQLLQLSAKMRNQKKDHKTNANRELFDSTYDDNSQKTVTVPIPGNGISFEHQCHQYGSEIHPLFFTQSGLSMVQNPGLVCHQKLIFQANSFHPYDPETRNSWQFHNLVNQNVNNSSEDQRNLSSATDQSGSTSFCNDNGSVNQVVAVRISAESRNENNHRSVQREEALTKFRLKRKDRCYEKKVRYESRKKLADQRPRVKGQFVRHVHTEPALIETEMQCN